MGEDSKELIKKHLEHKYYDYDRLIIKLIPKYEEMHQRIIDSLDFPKEAKLSVLDLGVGTGQTALHILEKFPGANLDGVDISPKVIEQAKIRLESFLDKVNLIEEDINKMKIERKYDVCVSFLCLHHLNENQKALLFKKVFDSLNPGGIFVIGDIIKFESEALTEAEENEWKDYVFKNFGEKEGKYWLKNYCEEDSPSSVPIQLKWLEQLGFKEVECVWEHMNCAVIVGKK